MFIYCDVMISVQWRQIVQSAGFDAQEVLQLESVSQRAGHDLLPTSS